ncbi:MAG: carboxypeptidase regulatory-like domain-containing protein, partial [Gemmatimonadales bacterium]
GSRPLLNVLLALGLVSCGGGGDDGGPNEWSVTVTTSVGSGTEVTVDGTDRAAPFSARWQTGESHTIGVPSPQSGNPGTRHLFDRWSDGGAQSHEVSVERDRTFTARLITEHELTVTTTPDGTGSVSAVPLGPWIVDGANVELTASPAVGWVLDRWEGDVTGDANPTAFAMDGPKSVTAVFAEQPGTVSGRATQQWDGAPLVGLVIHLIANGDTTTTTSDSNGDYEFIEVAVGAYTVAADTASVIPFGQFLPSRERAITVGRGEDVTGIDFSYQRAQIEVRTLADASSVSVGATVTVTLELDLSAIPLPASSLTGTIAWDSGLLDYTEGSAAGTVWDQLIVNEGTAGTLSFAAISVNGVGDTVVVALTYEVVAIATGTTEFGPVLEELSVIDPATGSAVDLVSITTMVETQASVTVQ